MTDRRRQSKRPEEGDPGRLVSVGGRPVTGVSVGKYYIKE